MILILTLSISTLTSPQFTETRIPCSSVKYAFTIEGTKKTYLATRREEYVTPYTNLADLQEQIQKQCYPNKNK